MQSMEVDISSTGATLAILEGALQNALQDHRRWAQREEEAHQRRMMAETFKKNIEKRIRDIQDQVDSKFIVKGVRRYGT